MPGLSVVVPCFNEEASLARFIPELVAQASQFPELEIIVVDDASSDGSPEVIAGLARQFPLQVLRNETNLGLGGAIRRGFEAARLDWITYLPADGQVPAAELGKLIPYLERYDLIIGWRASSVDYSRYRRLASKVYTALVSAAFGLRLRDYNWMQAWRRSLWTRFGSRSNSVFVCAEFLVRAQRARPRMIEIEIGYRPRQHGRAKNGSPRAAIRALKDIARLFVEEAVAGNLHFLQARRADGEDPRSHQARERVA